MSYPFLSKDDLWRKQINNNQVDLRARKKPSQKTRIKTSRASSANSPPKISHARLRLTREQILREMTAVDEYDIRLAKSMNVSTETSEEPTEIKSYISPHPVKPPAPPYLLGVAKDHSRRKKLSGIVFGFVMTLLLVVGVWGYGAWQRASSLDAHIRGDGADGYEALVQGKESAANFSFVRAEEHFAQAYKTFSSITQESSTLGARTTAALSILPFSLSSISQMHVVHTASLLAQAGVKISRAMRVLLPIPSSRDVLASSASLAQARELLVRVEEGIARISEEDIPIDFRSDFFDAYTALTHTDQSLSDLFSYGDSILNLLGHETPRTYLVVFQDPRELRPTGGLIRSFATFTIFQGEISAFKKEDIIVVDQQLTANIIPPYPITLLSNAWSMHDANWFTDFPTSAKQLMWFFEKSGGPTVDGVIAISLPQREAEELIVNFTNNLGTMSYDEQVKFVKGLTYYLLRKDILIYTRDTDTQEFIQKRGWSGHIAPALAQQGIIQDISAITYTNLTGRPISHVIDTSEVYTTYVMEDGSVRRTVRITRTYRAEGAEAFARDYIRIYTPLGSRLVSAEGFSAVPDISPFAYEENGFSEAEAIVATRLGQVRDRATGIDIFQEGDMTVFGGWMDLALGERKSIEIVYILPVLLEESRTYTLSLFSQPGISPIVTVRILGGDGARISWCQDLAYNEYELVYQYISTADITVVCTLKKT